jgi:hypothetical protein
MAYSQINKTSTFSLNLVLMASSIRKSEKPKDFYRNKLLPLLSRSAQG